MWEAKVIRKERHSSKLDILVEYSQGTNSFVEVIQTHGTQDATWLGNRVHETVTRLTELDGYEASIPIGSISPIVPNNPIPTGKDIAFSNYQTGIAKIQELRMLVTQGVLGTSDVQSTLGTLIPATKQAYNIWINS